MEWLLDLCFALCFAWPVKWIMVSFIELRSLEEGRRQDSTATCKVWAAFQLFSQAFKQSIGYKTLELIGYIRAGDINLDSSISDGIKSMGREETIYGEIANNERERLTLFRCSPSCGGQVEEK